MARLPARRGGTVDRSGSQAVGRRDPFSEFEDLYQRMGQLMDSAFDGLWPPFSRAQAPAADLTETGDAYVAEVELPGVGKDYISIELAGRELRVAGDYSREGTEDGRALRRTRRSGHFEYQVTLPGETDADKITASLADGVLTVTAPKTKTEKPRQIQITAG
jgi:HSP20 family protein